MKVSELKSILENMSDYDDVTVNGKPIEAVEMKQDMSGYRHVELVAGE